MSESTVYGVVDAALVDAMAGAGQVEITESVFDYWLGVLPPLRANFWAVQYNGAGVVVGGRPVAFAFAEGAESIVIFWERAGRFFCQNTSAVNGSAAGRRLLNPLWADEALSRELYAWAIVTGALDRLSAADKRFESVLDQLGGWAAIPGELQGAVSGWISDNVGLIPAWDDVGAAEEEADSVAWAGYSAAYYLALEAGRHTTAG